MVKKIITDPHAAREAKKYANPIASRELIITTLKNDKGPLTWQNIAKLLAIKEEDRQEALRHRLRAMERDGQILRNRKRAYGVVSKMNLVTGRIMGHADGFGFLIPDDASGDLFLSQREMRMVLHDDRAIARVVNIDQRGRKEGAIVEVIVRANQHIVGRLFSDAGICYVIANNRRISQDILIPPDNLLGAKHGQIVEIAIIEQPHRHRSPLGKVTAILGDHLAPGMEVNIAVRTFDLPHSWPEAVSKAANTFSETIPDAVIKQRVDLRALPFVTIDGQDARDFDDAVYAEALPSGSWRLWVAIADVSHYVKPDSILDKEAEKRGTSVYFPNQVIPMLPQVLSNGLCSLKPGVDRLSIACEMMIDKAGNTQSYEFHLAVIRSKARLTYNETADMLADKKPRIKKQQQTLVPHLMTMYALYQAMLKARQQRGAIDFELTETRFLFDKKQKIRGIDPCVRNDAHRLIEAFMVAANACAADLLLQHANAGLFRIHETPSGEKLANLREFLGELGLSLDGKAAPEPQHYASLLQKTQQRADKHLLHLVMLTSLKQAIYHPDNLGHFGLALDAYTHFTSPIRRYADLIVHRIICDIISSKHKKDKKWLYSAEDILRLSEHCSMTSRRADEATRDVANWLKCEYMQQHVGEVHNGIISGVTSFGLFVELNNIYIEGLLHITALKNDYYQFNATHHRLTGEHNKQVYQLGDAISVKVARVDLDDRKIELIPA